MSTEHKIEEYEVVKTSPTGEFERREKIVEDEGVVRRQNVYRLTQFIWLVFGILEAALGLRFFLKLIAANPANPFAQLVYNFTDLFMWPFARSYAHPFCRGHGPGNPGGHRYDHLCPGCLGAGQHRRHPVQPLWGAQSDRVRTPE
jgi:hypothetical protein